MTATTFGGGDFGWFSFHFFRLNMMSLGDERHGGIDYFGFAINHDGEYDRSKLESVTSQKLGLAFDFLVINLRPVA